MKQSMPASQKILYKGNGTSKKLNHKREFEPKPHFVPMDQGTELEGIRRDVFLDRYSLKDVDGKAMEIYPEQMWKRVAWGIAQEEKTPQLKKEWEEKFYEALRDFKFVPAGRILSGAGTGYQVTFYNCYVIPSPKDSREGIMENLGMTVEIQARGGGVGVNLSSLRPRGARVRKVNGTSSGPVNWASLYSTANHDVIQQGGSRRGALMIMLNDWHPDVEEFITVKQDLSKIPGANLSVCVSDNFMKAVKADLDWDLIYPDFANDPDYDEFWDGDIQKWLESQRAVKVYKTVKARDLWDLIARAAWRSAEPGVVFIDRYNTLSNSWYFEKIIATNPCLTADALVYTDKGLIAIGDLLRRKNSNKVLVNSQLSANKFQKPTKIVHTGKKQVYRLITEEGYELRLTGDHKVLTKLGWVEALNLKPNDEIILSDRKGGFGIHGNLQEGQILGWLVGDGTMKSTEAVLSFFGVEKEELSQNFATMVTNLIDSQASRSYPVGVVKVKGRDEARVSSTRLWKYAFQNGLKPHDKLNVPKRVFEGTEDMQRGFLQALFSADGHVAGTAEKGVSVRLTSISSTLLKDVQKLLLNFGVVSTIYSNRREEGDRLLPDGKGGSKVYRCKAYHDLVISKSNIITFLKEISFLISYKNQRILDWLETLKRGPYKENFVAHFESLIKEGIEDVYDLTESSTSSFIANGLVVHNCGEQGLGAWGVCNLGHINLSPFVKEGEMDYESLKDHVKIATRFLDNVIEANYYFSDENRKVQQDGVRRTGLGTLGLADALIKMKIRYGSEESLEVIEKIYKVIRDTAYDTSADLAKEKGIFLKFDKEKYLKGKFIKKLPKELKEKISKQGIRNGILLTQAPTGTISLLSGVSSGIEPVYEFSYKRTDRTGEHIVHHLLFGKWLMEHEGELVPDYFVSASQLTPEEHVKVQAMVQEYVDASISKTVNAPNEHTVDDVKKLYNMAYELGCKGVTYFRDGSRMGVLAKVDDEKKKEETKEINGKAHKVWVRPMRVSGSTYKMKTPVGTAFITINEDESGQPFEVFINIGKAGSDIAAMAEAMGRVISKSLKFNGNLTSREKALVIVDQLKGIGGRTSVGFGPNKVRSLPDAIGIALSAQCGFSTNGSSNLGVEISSAKAVMEAQKVGISDTLREQGESDPKMAFSEPTTAPNLELFPKEMAHGDICPSCGKAALVYEEGCAKCYSCGHAEC